MDYCCLCHELTVLFVSLLRVILQYSNTFHYYLPTALLYLNTQVSFLQKCAMVAIIPLKTILQLLYVNKTKPLVTCHGHYCHKNINKQTIKRR